MPKKIELDNIIFIFQDEEYISNNGDGSCLEQFMCFCYRDLNKEVETLEDKKIGKIQKIQQRTDTGLFGSMVNDEIKVAEAINKQANYLSDIVSTINEIIDKLNKGE